MLMYIDSLILIFCYQQVRTLFLDQSIRERRHLLEKRKYLKKKKREKWKIP